MSNKRDWRLFGLLVVAIIFSCLRFRFGFYHDGHSLITTSNILGSDSFDYWSDIWLKTNWGAQYRPLSFFVLFYVFSNLFGATVVSFHLLSLFLLLFVVYNLNLFFKRQSHSKNVAFLLTFLFLLHPLNWTYSEITFVGKTLIPTAIFVLGLNLYVDNGKSGFFKILFGMMLFSISILCHEATLFFAPILLVLGRQRKEVMRFLLLVPAAIYLFARFYFFGFPSEGWMLVSTGGSIQRIGEIASFVWYSFDLPFWAGTFLGLFLLLILVLVARSLSALFVVLASLLCVVPFGLLPNHFHVDRMVWGSVFVTLFFLQLYLKKMPYVSIVVMMWMALSGAGSLCAFHSRTNEYERFERQVNHWLEDFSFVMNANSDTCQTIRYKVKKLDAWNHLQQLPFLLAIKYPEVKKRVEIFSDEGGIIRMRIDSGSSYYCPDDYKSCIDIYERKHFFTGDGDCKKVTIFESGV